MAEIIGTDDDRLVVVHSTYPDVTGARDAGRDLVSRRLAACVLVMPEAFSVYRWKGVVEEANEAVLLAKTRASLTGAVTAAITERHPYELPAVLVLSVEAASRAYGTWILDETAAPLTSS
jgi:periplasmic divalent cation tolerance protein